MWLRYFSFTTAVTGYVLFYNRYHAALRNTGRVSLSTPYIDAFGSGVVITAFHTIYRGELNHKHSANDQVIGVMDADFPLSYFNK